MSNIARIKTEGNKLERKGSVDAIANTLTTRNANMEYSDPVD